MKKNIFFIGIIVLIIFACSNYKDSNSYVFNLDKVPLNAKFIDNDWYIWGGSVVEKDGKYHMFYSRWPKKFHFNAWLTYSEVAHAVSDSPFGPFRHKDIALPSRDPKLWDGYNTHNPTVKEFDGKYYIYYTGNTGNRKVKEKSYNWEHRNNQRIGVAVANHPNGPWKRFDQPLIDVSNDSTAHDALMLANPSVTRHPDGRYVLVYKCVGKKRKLPNGGPVVHMVAFSDSPTGPFTKHPDPIFTAKGNEFPAEDPYIWTQDGKMFAIVKDFKGTFTKKGQSLALFESKNGIEWDLSQNPLVSTVKIEWENRTQKVKHLERPQLFFKNGKPYSLMCASDTLDVNGVLQSFNVQIPVSFEKK
ncbi:glycoside hydrolase family protein [Flavicella sp.]|uniref:glycoside hydrolase family protein n=1 Tax=Flavicella sp. TaxID=2957742 RepID=UPI0026038A23|nr:glycoside hydrolase family protein [Flavicella sp.]MDG1804313.1 glycoside hydrolase family protein [Flavicella sp.]